MFIENDGGVAYIQPSKNRLVLALTDPAGTVTVEQMGVDKNTWFPFVYGGVGADLDASNTAQGIFAPMKLRVTAVGTGVRLYNVGGDSYKPEITKR